MVNFGPLAAEISLLVWSTPANFNWFASWLRYCTDVAQWRSTKLCTMFGSLLGWYAIYTFSGALAPNGILPRAKFTLRPSLAFSYIGSVTAWHSSSVCQSNFAAWDKEGNYRTFTPHSLHLYSAGRPSLWASAHILVLGLIISNAVMMLGASWLAAAVRPLCLHLPLCP